MNVYEIQSQKDVQKVFQSGYPYVIIDHYATWCQPCKMLAPKFQELAAQYSSNQVLFAKCDSANGLYNVTGLPTIEYYFKGKKVHEVRGLDWTQIVNALERLLTHPSTSTEGPSMQENMSTSHNTFNPSAEGVGPPLGAHQSVANVESERNVFSTGGFKPASKGAAYKSYSQL